MSDGGKAIDLVFYRIDDQVWNGVTDIIEEAAWRRIAVLVDARVNGFVLGTREHVFDWVREDE